MRPSPRLLALAGLALVAALPAQAAEDDVYMLRDMYLGIRAIGAVSMMDGLDTRNFNGTLNAQNDNDDVAGVGGVLGYRWRALPVRTELEVAHRFRFDLDLQDRGAPGGTIDYEANVRTTSVLFNALYEWRNDTSFTPFIGGSVGWARNTADSDRVVIVPGLPRTSKETDSDDLAWGGMLGVDWRFAGNWSAELAYRYIDLGEVEVGPFSANNDGVTADDYTAHDVILSLSYRF